MAADLIVRVFFHGLIAFNAGATHGEALLLKAPSPPHSPEIVWSSEQCRESDNRCRNHPWQSLHGKIVRFEWMFEDQEPEMSYAVPPTGPPPDADSDGFPDDREFEDFRWLVDIKDLAFRAARNGATDPITSTVVLNTGQLASCRQVTYKDGDEEKLFAVTFPNHAFRRSITEVATLTMGPATAQGIKIKLSPGNVEVVLVGEKCGEDQCVDIVIQNAPRPVPNGRKPRAPHFDLFRGLFDHAPNRLSAELDEERAGPPPHQCDRYEEFEKLVQAHDRRNDPEMAKRSLAVLDRPICPLTKF